MYSVSQFIFSPVMFTLFFFLLHAEVSAGLLCDQSCQPRCQPFVPIGSCEGNTEPVILHTHAAGKPITVVRCKESDIVAPYCPENIERSTDEGSDGANISFSVIDDIDEHPMMWCSHVSGMKFPVGQTNVTCQLEDSSNNRRHCSFVVTVVDTEPPELICEDRTYTADGTSVSNMTIVPTVYDNADTSPSVVCNASNRAFYNGFVNDFPLGLTRVICMATDYSGNVNSCTFIVSVVGQIPVVFLLEGQNSRIRVSNTSLSPIKGILSGPAVLDAFAFDPVDQRLFFSSEEAQLIRRDTMGLNEEIPNLMNHINKVRSAAVDEIGRKFYAVPGGKTISYVSLPNAEVYGTINTDIDVKHLAVAHDSEQSYLLVTNKTAIYLMLVDGGNQKILFSDDSLTIMGVAWDRKGKRIFFTSSPALRNSSIEVIDIDGGNRTVLIERADIAPRRVAYHDGFVYWINRPTAGYGRGIGVISADVENAQEFDFTTVTRDYSDIMIRDDVVDNTYL